MRLGEEAVFYLLFAICYFSLGLRSRERPIFHFLLVNCHLSLPDVDIDRCLRDGRQ